MAHKSSTAKKDKEPFFKNKWNILFTLALIGMLAYMLFYKDEEGRNGFERLFTNIDRGVERVTEGCAKPADSEVEAHFKDKAGALPVERDFDSPPGALCGNGERYYCTSKPPKKPIPLGWEQPPLPGTDPSYEGPDPLDPFKESPYAMPSSKAILARNPIRDRDDPGQVEAMQAALARGAGKLGYLGYDELPARFGKLRPEVVTLDHGLFESDDDRVVAEALTAQGVEYVLVERKTPPVKAWIEEQMDTVRLRLRDAVTLAWFHPVVLGSGYALFRVAEPFEIPTHIKRRLASRVRTLLTGGQPPELEVSPPIAAVGDDVYRAVVSLRKRAEPRLKGRKLARRMAHGKTVVEAVDEAVARIKDDWGQVRRGNQRAYGFEVSTDLPKEMADLEVEIDVLFDICALTDRTPSNLLWYLELGLEGLMLRDPKKDLVHYLEPSYGVHMESKGEITFLETLLAKSDLDQFLRDPKKKGSNKQQVLYESKWQQDREFRFARFRSLNWVEEPGGTDIVELYRGTPLKTIWDVTRASLVRSLELGAQWLMENQSADGQYAYKYTPTNKPGRRWTAGGNIVRHALNPYTLLMVNKIKADPKYVESAKKGIEFTLMFLRREGNRCVICHRDPPARYYNAKIGTVAVTILSILKLGDVADISEYDDVLRCLGEELLYLQDKNGHFRQYDVPVDHPYYGAESTIAPGEFVFALARLYSHYGDKRYKESIDRALPFYMKAWRQLLSERTPQGIFDEEHRVNLIGIVPWLVTAMNDLHKKTGEQQYADIGFEQQDWIDDEFYWYLNRAQYADYVGSSFKVHRELPAINSCQYTEGAAAAYDMAKRVNRNIEARRQVVVHGMRFCLQLQFDSYGSTFFLPLPEEAMGGYRYTLGHLRLRNDYSYHAMAAIAQAVEYLEPDDYPAERPLRIPPVLAELLGGLPNPTADVPRGAGPTGSLADAGPPAAAGTADAGAAP